jgi:hypothetical protein
LSKLGYLGLQDKEKVKPQMPNQIKPDKEKIIRNDIIEYPTHGPRRIANELNQPDITISEIMSCRSRKLNHRLDKLFYAQDKSYKCIYYNNFKRTNQGYRLKGKTPYQKLLDGKRKYALPFSQLIVLFSIGKSRKCKHHLELMNIIK